MAIFVYRRVRTPHLPPQAAGHTVLYVGAAEAEALSDRGGLLKGVGPPQNQGCHSMDMEDILWISLMDVWRFFFFRGDIKRIELM